MQAAHMWNEWAMVQGILEDYLVRHKSSAHEQQNQTHSQQQLFSVHSSRLHTHSTNSDGKCMDSSCFPTHSSNFPTYSSNMYGFSSNKQTKQYNSGGIHIPDTLSAMLKRRNGMVCT
ncbi:hypothetical protein A2U01_0024576 [Trifolium medium]|uniref:Uncharacterized protein n=1 Tax=Trifolium medium TaxID=97028 RepID=A0A392NWQ8_9FABA|nr:hypothetical protein [Trifolium medium]